MGEKNNYEIKTKTGALKPQLYLSKNDEMLYNIRINGRSSATVGNHESIN
jgi:hypothetical protein